MRHGQDQAAAAAAIPAATSAATRGRAAEFEAFMREGEPKLRRALVAAYGFEDGRDATAEALAFAWEHWERVREMPNAMGYLFRVAQSSRRRRRVPVLPEASWCSPVLTVRRAADGAGRHHCRSGKCG